MKWNFDILYTTDKGELFTFGDGRHGKLGQGDESFSNLFKPAKVQRLQEFTVFHVSFVVVNLLFSNYGDTL